jgi:hypothetical protein
MMYQEARCQELGDARVPPGTGRQGTGGTCDLRARPLESRCTSGLPQRGTRGTVARGLRQAWLMAHHVHSKPPRRTRVETVASSVVAHAPGARRTLVIRQHGPPVGRERGE